MAGIYLHIPFCKQACFYCDFHFTTSLKYMDELVDAICKELEFKKDRLSNQLVQSIYFGGGTPSLLSYEALNKIFDVIYQNYQIAADVEITLEANPDDLSKSKINELRQLPINRFSIGIQSFYEEDLKWMNRAHHAEEALSCVKRSQDAGFENLTIDLIYGFPLLNDVKWKNNIDTAIALQVPHISAYSLTVEDRTALAHQIKIGKTPAPNEEQSARQFLMLSNQLASNSFEHYEISNYALQNHYAVHNTNYWRGLPYLGIGPSAHGFDGERRYMNIANNMKYLTAISEDKLPETIENLSVSDKFNEYIMTSLRTMWGLDLDKIEKDFGTELKQFVLNEVEVFVAKNQLNINNQKIILTKEGKLFADGIAAAIFIDEEDINKFL